MFLKFKIFNIKVYNKYKKSKGEKIMNYSDGKQAVLHMTDRMSVRNFSDKKISDDDLKLILDSGLKAASGGNLQPYSIIIERDKSKNEELSKLCGNQPFIKNADVNLIFLLDWYKYSVYAKQMRAPFVADKAYMHFLIALEDVICTAQTIETASHMMGIGSCYVGTSNSVGKELVDMYGMPKLTYPVVILSLGYPKASDNVPKRPKMPYDMMVFEGEYKKFTEDEIFEGFSAKYGDGRLELSKNEDIKKSTLENLKLSLLTTYDEKTADEIVKKAEEGGFVNETQRRFGLHYAAHAMVGSGKRILEMMKEQGFDNLSM